MSTFSECIAGYSGSPCDRYLRGSYKKNVGNEDCVQCPAGTTTFIPGSTSADDCSKNFNNLLLIQILNKSFPSKHMTRSL